MKSHFLASASLKNIALLAALFAGISGTAYAQTKGFIAAAKQNPLPVYKSPEDSEPSEKIAANGLPWPILDESKDGFFLVSLGGKRFWVDSMDVTANRESTNRCSAQAGSQSTAGVPSAANVRCN
jgi:hypothetical protein